MRYEHDYGATRVWLRTSDGLRMALRAAGSDVAGTAQAIAPRDTGAYVDSISVIAGETTDRVSVLVEADDAAAAPIEFGNARTGGIGHNVLVRAAEICGFDVDPGAT